MEIIRLGYSSFFSKCFKFHARFRNAIKNPEKVFWVPDNGVSCCWEKFCMFRREYLSSVVNMLTKSLKMSDQTKAAFFQLNLARTHKKLG